MSDKNRQEWEQSRVKKVFKEARCSTECQLFAIINIIFFSLFSIITNKNKHIKYQPHHITLYFTIGVKI